MMVPLFTLVLALAPPGPGGMPPQQQMTPMPMMTPLGVPSPTAAPPAFTDAQATTHAKEWLLRLQSGNIDRSQLSASMSSALTPSTVSSIHAQYGRLGTPTSFTLTGKQSLTNGDTEYDYRVVFKQTTVTEKLVVNAAGRIDGLSLSPGG